MTSTRDELVLLADRLMQPSLVKDYCPNGLQVQGRQKIKRLVAGVTASQALLDAAVAEKADAILVHHGYFWQGEAQPITGIKYQRIATLIEHGISLIAYHLPLDIHPEWGNNAQLAKVLGLEECCAIDALDLPLVWRGKLARHLTAKALSRHISTCLNREPLYVGANIHGADDGALIETVAWCTGGAQQYIDVAADYTVDAYISGEISEQTVHIARERGVHFFAAGHHATERYGVKAFGEHLAKELSLDFSFIDIDNPA